MLGALLPAPAFACRLALLLALDVSSSIDDREYLLQRDGLANALVAPEVAQAFLRAPGPVALSIFEWSGQFNQKMVVDWQMIHTKADLEGVARRIGRAQRKERLFPTALGSALGFAAHHIGRAPLCRRRTLDVSGDGRNNDGFPPASAYRHFPYDGVTVNALAIGGEQELSGLVAYYAAEVIRGPGAFVETAFDHSDFERAMRRKLERELTPLAVGLKTTAPERFGALSDRAANQ